MTKIEQKLEEFKTIHGNSQIGIIEWLLIEYEKLESRSCEGCMYLSIFGFCTNHKSIAYRKDIVEDKDPKKDACNKWEEKEAK